MFIHSGISSSQSLKLVRVFVGGCPAPVFLSCHNNPQRSISFYLIYRTFLGAFFQYSCCRCRRYIYLVPPFGCHRSGLFFSSRDSIRRYRWWVDNRKLTHDTVIVLLPSLSLSLAATRHETPGAREWHWRHGLCYALCVYVANANMPRARSTARDLPSVPFDPPTSNHSPAVCCSALLCFAFFFFAFAFSFLLLSTYCYTIEDHGEMGGGWRRRWDNPSGNAVRSYDTVPLDWREFYLSSWDTERGERSLV